MGKERREVLRLARKQARIAMWEKVKSQLGDQEHVPLMMRSELRLHARRMAILKRIQAVAATKNDQKAKDRVVKLVAKENQRHQKRMEKLADKSEKAEEKAEETQGREAQKTEDKAKDKAEEAEAKKGDQK